MLARHAAGAVLAGAFLLAPGERPALAQPASAAPPAAASAPAPSPPAPSAAPVAPASAPLPAPSAPAPVPSAPLPRAAPPTTAPRGAVVLAVGDPAAPAARALAHDVYRDPVLRPSLDEPTARVLTGGPLPEDAPPRLQEIAALRASIAESSTDITTRHLLASLGATLHAELVVAVSLEAGRPLARVLHTTTAAYERIELGATVETAPDGAKAFLWPGASTTLHNILLPPPPPEPPKPLAAAAPPEPPKPERKQAPKDQTPAWKSPWFWGAIGGVAAVGVTVFVLTKTSNGPSAVHLDGTVGP